MSSIEEKYLFSINVAINGIENGQVGSILVREGDQANALPLTNKFCCNFGITD